MRGGSPLDGRRAKALHAEMLRRAVAVLGGDGQERPPGEIADAMLGVAARIEEEVTRRLDRVPDKQTDNFFNAMGIGRDPARPARVPVAFALAEPPPEERVAPASTRLMASGEAGPVVFETSGAIALVPGSIGALIGVDADQDRIFRPPDGVVAAALPRAPAAERTLRGGAAAGEDKLQVSLATDLAEGTILAIGGDGAREHRITAIEDDLITVEPPLERTLERDTAVAVVSDFAPFAGHRDQQSHALYLGHETLLNVPSALSIAVAGVPLLPETRWSWHGGEPARWRDLVPTTTGGRLILTKEEGQPVKTGIDGRESLWLRAQLPGGSGQAFEARDIRLSLAGEGPCKRGHTDRCIDAESGPKVEFEAIANTTPVVLNSHFHPFGREPRLFDSFYIGCAEAFSKPGAEVSLCFEFAGPQLGPLAAVSDGGVTQIFGVGKDGLLYRAQLGRDQPRLIPLMPSREDMGGIAVEPQAPVAARLDGKTVFVAIGAKGAVHLAQTPFDEPLEAGLLKWKPLVSEMDRDDPIAQVALVAQGGFHKLLARTKAGVFLAWTWPNRQAEPVLARDAEPDRMLVPVQGADAALIIEPAQAAGQRRVRFEGLPLADLAEVRLPATGLAAWAHVPKDQASATVYLAGTDEAGSKLQVVQLAGSARDPIPDVEGAFGRIAFEPPPGGAALDGPPTILTADPKPRRFIFRGAAYGEAGDLRAIESADGPSRHFILTPGWIAVHGPGQGLLHRPARNGRWADEYDLAVTRTDLALATGGAVDAELAAWSRDPKGGRLDVVKSATSERRLLVPVLTPPGVDAASARKAYLFRRAKRDPGTAIVAKGGISLVDDRASQASEQANAQLVDAAAAHGVARTEHERVQGEEKAALAAVALAQEKQADAERKWSSLVAEASSLRAAAQAAQTAYGTATALRAAAETALATTKAAAAPAPSSADPVNAARDALQARTSEETAARISWEAADRKAVEAEARVSVANAIEAQAKAAAAALAAEAASLRAAAQADRASYDEATVARAEAEAAAAASDADRTRAEDDLRRRREEEADRKAAWEAADRKAAEAQARATVANAAEAQAKTMASLLGTEATSLRTSAQTARGAYERATASRIAAAAVLAAAQAVHLAEADLDLKKRDEADKKKSSETAAAKATTAEGDAAKASEEVGRKASDVTRLKATHRTLADRLGEAAGTLQEKKTREAEAKQAADGVGPVEIPLDGLEAHILLAEKGSPARDLGIWRLTRAAVTDKEWQSPDFPAPAKDKALQYQVLTFLGETQVSQAVEIERPGDLTAQLAEVGSLHSDEDPDVVVSAGAVEHFDDRAVILFPGRLVRAVGAGQNGRALLTTRSGDWSVLGPSQPPNPALSWEYWNGRSWWALDAARFVDRTANLLLNGGVFFAVPADLAETEVAGRGNHWIRARLVGGDYGEAKVTVKSTTEGTDASQTVERDMTTIRAPFVTALRLGFCARTEVRPEIVLTEDSLKFLDQTSANIAGLPVSIFAPVANAMAGGPAAGPAFSRGLMVGFERPVFGDPVSLYVDAAPGVAAGELIAEILRDGRFEPVDVRDGTQGLAEPGLIQLSLNAAPDRAELFGAVAYWLRLRPSGDASAWSPRIRAIHLNAVRAYSVETREMESLGQSAGIPHQMFRLAEAPVAPGSLELRVREPLGEEERLAPGVDAPPAIGPMPGPWVRWTEVDDLGDPAGPARAFLLDAELGLVRFGDGRRGAIPPLGAELLAVAYRHVAGAAGNDVAPGAKLQLLSPLAGIEQVVALDSAAGGSDIESAEAARRRGAAKLRHGNHILTLADLEDYARAWSPEIAQARAANRRGAVRLVVAGSGREPRPAPAMLRELERAIRANAGFVVARRDGLDVVAPRLLPLRVELELEPDDPDRFIEMADAVEAALVALFDPAAGGLDGQGWPLGRLPAPGDVHAALEPASRTGFVCSVALLRADRRPAAPLPAAIPSDVLVRLDLNDIVATRRAQVAA
jgi:hypothetical protein